LADAYREFQTVIRTNPDDYQAFGNLGLICLASGRNEDARTFFETALRLNPDDAVARRSLERLQLAK
jgi:Flp pilus assembly protein TadD